MSNFCCLPGIPPLAGMGDCCSRPLAIVGPSSPLMRVGWHRLCLKDFWTSHRGEVIAGAFVAPSQSPTCEVINL
jgi:hypothetical protein